MSLQDLQEKLKQFAAQGTLNFGSLAEQVPALTAVFAELPAESSVVLGSPSFTLTGSGASQLLTVNTTINWGLLQGLSAIFTIALDSSANNGYIVTLQVQLPKSTQLGIPGVSWFEFSQFSLGGTSLPFSLYSTGLQPTALVNLGATLLIKGSSSQTPIPISIASDPTGILQLTLNTAAVEMPSINDILAAFGDTSGINLPPTINSLLNFSLLDLSVAFDPSANLVARIGVEIGNSAQASGKWDIIPGYLALDSYRIGLAIFDPFHTRQIGGLIATKITVGTVAISVAATHPPSGGWEFAGSTQEGDVISIGEFITYLTQKFKVPAPPDWLQTITLKNILVTFNTTTKDFTFTVTADAEISGKACELVIDFSLTYPNGSYTLKLDGTLTVGGQIFTLDFEKTGTNTQMGVTWTEAPGQSLSLQDLARIFGNDSLTSLLGNIPSNMNLALVSLSFTYDFTQKELVLTAVSKNYGHLVFVAAKPADSWVFAFLVAIGEINLTRLPLIGEEVGKFGKFEIDDLNFLACSGPIAPDQVKNINKLIEAAAQKTGATLPTLPETAAGLQRGGNLSMTFYVADYMAPVAVGTATPKTGGSQTLVLLGADNLHEQATSALVLANPANPQTQNGYWINLQKAFGPVYMDKIGFNYAGGDLEILFNFSLKLGALTITLDGLMVGSELTKFDPIFGLQGLSITFNSGAVAISGGFIKQEINGVTQYNGQALIKAGTFSLAAMGSYAKVNGETSLFIFALITEPPLGGPPYFFITGVAAGFGYNRGLVIPTIDQVSTFPLVSGFVPGQSSPFSDNDPGKALQVLVSQNIVPIQIGQNWLAAGVQFTSFEMLQSFALVVVEFGASLEIALLGLTTASIPTGDPRPLLFAQLAMEVRILPDDGLVAVDAKLTSNSYILDSACHLTGGFAFYIWFGKNLHAGDFVVTLGGYHPNFNKPAHYPDVPRLGFNWVVTSELTIKGGMYFALTPVCLMAGGSLQALWQSGNLKAWFDLGADFLIAWKPYHYEIDVYISFGVSYTFNINLLFVTITETISVSLGADLSIWGPAFSGVAHIHLWIISFTVHFGASSSQTPPPIPWAEFEQSFLPAATDSSHQQARLARRSKLMAADVAPADDPVTQYQVWTVRVTEGLAKTVAPGPDNPDDMDWIVNPEGTMLEAKTLIPAKKYILVVQGTDSKGKLVQVDPTQIKITNQEKLAGINLAFGVGPSDVATTDFESGITVTLTYEDGLISNKLIFYFTAIIQTAPKAMWLPGPADISNNETLVSNVLLGFDITSGEAQPDETPWADLSLLGFKDYPYEPALKWAAPKVVDGPAQPAAPFAQLEQTIISAPSRVGILGSLVAGGTPINPTVDVQYMATEAAGNFLLAPPIFAFEYALPSSKM